MLVVVVAADHEQPIPGFCSMVIVRCFKFAGVSSRSQGRPAVICCCPESGFLVSIELSGLKPKAVVARLMGVERKFGRSSGNLALTDTYSRS
jgi:hypothetical protein